MTKGRWFKLLCVALYGLIVGGIAAWVHYRAAVDPHTVAARTIEKNQMIAETDLRSLDQHEIVGRFATRKFLAGETIGTRDVSVSPVPAPANAIATVISMPRPPHGDPTRGGSTVQACLDRRPLGKPGKVLWSVCDARTCSVTVQLDAWPKELEAPGVAARLSAVPLGEPCDSEAIPVFNVLVD